LNNWDYVVCPRFPKQLNPSIRVPLFSLEEGDEILVAELRMGTVILKVIVKFGSILDIHKVGVPLASEGGNRI